jgi:FkbM family methyltransferase
MNVPTVDSTFTSRIATVTTLFKKKGIVNTGGVILKWATLQLQIKILGQSRTIELDGCKFPLRDVPNTSMKLHLLRGSYELPERSAALRYIKPEWSVVELGGCIGVVACITNKLLSQPERHVVVEANPLVLAQLESNRAVNQCSFSIVNRALAYNSSSVRVTPSSDFWGTSLYKQGDPRPSIDVPATQLGEIIKDAQFESFALICDIEGQEYELVRNELEILSKAKIIIMELHPDVLGEDKVSEIIFDLDKIGFEVAERMATVVVMCKKAKTD